MRMRFVIVLFFVTALIPGSYAFYNWSDSSQQATCIDPVICQLDSMSLTLFSRSKFFVDDNALINGVNMPYDQIPKYTDKQIVDKMKLIPSVIPMAYNTTI